jgi:hypothetical protein
VVDLRESSTSAETRSSGADAAIHRLFDVGLVLRVAAGTAPEADALRLSLILDQLDTIIHELQSGALDELIGRPSSVATSAVAARIDDVADAIEHLPLDVWVGHEKRDAIGTWLAESARALEVPWPTFRPPERVVADVTRGTDA